MYDDKDKKAGQMNEVNKTINGTLLNYGFFSVGDFPVFPPPFNGEEYEDDDDNDKRQ
jgi:hypothetical protein